MSNEWKIEATTGLWCPSMFWAARVLQCYRQRVFCKPNPKG